MKFNDFKNWWGIKGTFAALCIVSTFSLVSISACSLNHILLFLASPILISQYLNRNKENSRPFSAYILVAFVLVGLLSNLINDLHNPTKSYSQIKYFLFAIIGVFAYQELYQLKVIKQKKVNILLKLFLIATSLGTISGLIALKTGYNPLKLKEACHPDRACGVYGMYMSYGYGIQFFMVLVTGMLLKFKIFKERFNIPPAFLILVWVVNFLGLYLSYTRGALLGFLAAIPFFFYRRYKKIFISSFILIPLIFLVSFFTIPKFNHMFTDGERIRSNEKRISQYLAAYYIFKEKPLLGIGVRNFEPNVVKIKEKYNLPYSEMVGHAHNNFLEILATMGGIGFILLVLFHLAWIYEMHKRNDLIGHLVLPVIVALAVSGQAQYTFGDGENMFFLMSLYSLSMLRLRSEDTIPC